MYDPYMFCLGDLKSEPILRDAFDGWNEGNGIFSAMESLEGVDLPWAEESTITGAILDIEYFGNFSGAKFCSPLVKFSLDDDDVVTAAGLETLARIIVAKYLGNWQKLWTAFKVQYSPINNYDMTEDYEGSGEHSDTDTLTHGHSISLAHGRTMNENVFHYGYNSPAPASNDQPVDRIVDTEGGTDTTTNSGNDVTVKSGDNSDQHYLHRTGNIGVTTNQKMLTDEINLWRWNFFNTVFKNVDEELALLVYDPCRV